MKILVTGGAGFIGSAVVRLAVRRGHEVVNLDALTYAANPENVASVSNSPLYHFEQADIRDRAAIDATGEPLPVEQAFRATARALDDHTVEIRFQSADGYYLYRPRFKFDAEGVSRLTKAACAGHGEGPPQGGEVQPRGRSRFHPAPA